MIGHLEKKVGIQNAAHLCFHLSRCVAYSNSNSILRNSPIYFPLWNVYTIFKWSKFLGEILDVVVTESDLMFYRSCGHWQRKCDDRSRIWESGFAKTYTFFCYNTKGWGWQRKGYISPTAFLSCIQFVRIHIFLLQKWNSSAQPTKMVHKSKRFINLNIHRERCQCY